MKKILLITCVLVLSLFLVPSAMAVNSKVLLKGLKVSNEISNKAYNRNDFPHWIKQPNGCTTRQQVLITEKLIGSPSNCVVNNGAWYSEYEGKTYNNPSQLDIDHFVPLAQAYRSGAYKWSLSTRRAFANDLGYSWSLIAVSASQNRSKSDQDPATWLPPLKEFRCRYVSAWVAVKYRWKLNIDKSEKNAITKVMNTCTPGKLSIQMPRLAKVVIDNSLVK